jgi:two-component system, OmpR family, response regulator
MAKQLRNDRFLPSPDMQVTVLHWPDEEPRRTVLRSARCARLLLVAPEAPAPVVADPLEDWIRLPAEDRDLQARLDGLTLRLQERLPRTPTIDDDGLLRADDRWVALPPIEARLATPLLDRFGAVVGRDALLRAGWPDGAPNRNVLDVHILRLRRRLDDVGLSIRTVRSRGYLLE